jgi:hypothetical protein
MSITRFNLRISKPNSLCSCSEKELSVPDQINEEELSVTDQINEEELSITDQITEKELSLIDNKV